MTRGIEYHPMNIINYSDIEVLNFLSDDDESRMNQIEFYSLLLKLTYLSGKLFI